MRAVSSFAMLENWAASACRSIFSCAISFTLKSAIFMASRTCLTIPI